MADPHEHTVRLHFPTIEDGGAAAQDRVAIADDQAVGQIDWTVNLKGVSGTHNSDVTDDISFSHHQQPFGLSPCRVPYREVHEVNAAGVVDHECRAARRKSSWPFVRADV